MRPYPEEVLSRVSLYTWNFMFCQNPEMVPRNFWKKRRNISISMLSSLDPIPGWMRSLAWWKLLIGAWNTRPLMLTAINTKIQNWAMIFCCSMKWATNGGEIISAYQTGQTFGSTRGLLLMPRPFMLKKNLAWAPTMPL